MFLFDIQMGTSLSIDADELSYTTTSLAQAIQMFRAFVSVVEENGVNIDREPLNDWYDSLFIKLKPTDEEDMQEYTQRDPWRNLEFYLGIYMYEAVTDEDNAKEIIRSDIYGSKDL